MAPPERRLCLVVSEAEALDTDDAPEMESRVTPVTPETSFARILCSGHIKAAQQAVDADCHNGTMIVRVSAQDISSLQGFHGVQVQNMHI